MTMKVYIHKCSSEFIVLLIARQKICKHTCTRVYEATVIV